MEIEIGSLKYGDSGREGHEEQEDKDAETSTLRSTRLMCSHVNIGADSLGLASVSVFQTAGSLSAKIGTTSTARA